ncbi:MAG: hypothetical protein ACK5LL_06560 [Suipraeoptans sp.]
MNSISKIKDETVLSEFEVLANKSLPLEHFTKAELIARAKISLDDAKNNRVTTQEDLEKECERW